MRIVTLIGAIVMAALLTVSCDGTKTNNPPVSSVTVTATYVENGDTIVVEGLNFGTTEPSGTLTKVTTSDALTDLPIELTVTDFSETRIAFALPETFAEAVKSIVRFRQRSIEVFPDWAGPMTARISLR